MRVAPTGAGYPGWACAATPRASHAARTATCFHHLVMSQFPLSHAASPVPGLHVRGRTWSGPVGGYFPTIRIDLPTGILERMRRFVATGTSVTTPLFRRIG